MLTNNVIKLYEYCDSSVAVDIS